MKKLLLLGALLTAGAIGLQDVSVGHGGTYRGPGDTVPPGGGGGGGGAGPSTPGPSGPSTPGPSGPSTPGPAAPGPGGGAGGPKGPPVTGGGGDTGPDLTVWQFWWGFNREPYLNLKAKVHSGTTLTGSDDFFLGHGQQAQAKDNLKPSEETIRQKIVPALVTALENETNNDIVTACLIALAKIGDEKTETEGSVFEEKIKAKLGDSVQEISETAAVSLGILANPASVETLRMLLQDEPEARTWVGGSEVNYRTRAFAAYGLGLIGNRTEDPAVRENIVKILQGVLALDRMSTRDVKVAAVIAMGLVPIAEIHKDLTPEEQEAEYEIGTDASRSREDQIAFLLDYFQDEKSTTSHFLIRAHAPRSLAKLIEGGSPELREQVIEALLPYTGGNRAKGEKELRESATLAFGQIGKVGGDKSDEKIVDSLLEGTGDPDQQSKHFSLIALAQVGGRVGEGDPSDDLKKIRRHLQQQLLKGNQRKPWAGISIGIMERALIDSNGPSSADMLAALRSEAADAKSPMEVGAYAIGLGIARDVEAESILLKKLENTSDDSARGYVAVGLGLMNSLNAIEPIQEIVEESKYRGELLKSSAIALGLLGDKDVVPQLTNMLQNEAKTLSTQAAIASALGFIGDARSIDPLIEMLKDPNLTDKARAFAAVALGIVADKELLPWNAKISVDINYRANTTTLTGENGTGILDIL